MKTIILLATFLIIAISCKAQLGQGYALPHQDNQTTTFAKVRKPQNAFTDANFGHCMQDNNGQLWFCSNGEGVYVYDPTSRLNSYGKQFRNYTKADGLNSNVVYCAFQDKQGTIWVGTQEGLHRFEPMSHSYNGIKAFTQITFVLQDGKAIANYQNGVWSIMQDKNGTIYFGTDEGVFCYNPLTAKKGGVIKFTPFLSNRSIVNKDSLSLRGIFAMLEDKQGNLWFGACYKDGISRFDGKNLVQISDKKFQRVDQIMQDKKGDIYFAGVFAGVCKYQDGKIIKDVFNLKKGEYGSFCVLEDNKGNLWFDQNGTLHFYNGKKINEISISNGLPSSDMMPLLQDKNNYIWFAGPKMGLYRYDANAGKGKQFMQFSE
jgi:ligand-binding sensor domain-containing protein